MADERALSFGEKRVRVNFLPTGAERDLVQRIVGLVNVREYARSASHQIGTSRISFGGQSKWYSQVSSLAWSRWGWQ